MTSLRMPDGLLPPLALTLALVMSGCPGDDGSSMDTDTDTEGTTGTSTTSPTSPTSPTNPTNPTDPSSSGTTVVVDGTGPDLDSSSGEPPPEGQCLGLDAVGNIDTVFSAAGGMPIDTTCDPAPMPCGGDVVGTWDVESSCGYDSVPNPLEADCPGSTFMLEVLGQSGSMTFENDGTFVRDFTVDVQAVITADPMACFGADCAALNDAIQMDDPTASCVDVMGTCTCTFPPPAAPPPMMGTYEVMGDVLVLDMAGEVQQLDFCVAGERLDTWDTVADVTLTEALCNDEQDCMDELADAHDAYFCALPE